MSTTKRHSRNISVDKIKEEKKENDKVHKKFNLEESEIVVSTMKCTYKSRSGKLRVTDNHLCFSSSLLGKEKKKIVSFSDVLDIENQSKDIKTSQHHNGIKITLKDGKPFSFHFKDNEAAYLIIEGQWEASGNQRGSRLNESTGSAGGMVHIKHFNLPDSESLIRDYHCALKSTFKLYGKLYLTPNYILYYGGITHQKKAIKLRDIITLEKLENSKNSIKIDTKHDNFIFTSFNDSRDNVYNEMMRIFEIARNNPTPTSRSRSGSTPTTPTLTHQGVDPNALKIGIQSIGSNNKSTPSPSPSPSHTPKSHSRKSSVNNPSLDQNIENRLNQQQTLAPPSTNSKPNSRKNSISTTPPTSSSTTQKSYTTPPPQSPPQQAPPSPRVSERLGNLDKAHPIPVEQQKPQIKDQVKKGRSCCFALF